MPDSYTPVDYDPFAPADAGTSAGPSLTPVDYDPFQDEGKHQASSGKGALVPVDYDPFSGHEKHQHTEIGPTFGALQADMAVARAASDHATSGERSLGEGIHAAELTAGAAGLDTAADAGMAAAGAARGIDLMRGDTAASDAVFRNVVEPASKTAAEMRHQAYSESGAGAAAGEVLGLAPLLAGGEAMLPERAAGATRRGLGWLIDAGKRALPVASGIGQEQASRDAIDVMNRGGDAGTAEKVYGTSLGANTAANLLPASAGGRLATRAASGAALGAGASMATQEALHEVAPDYIDAPSIETAGTGAGLGALVGAALGARAARGHEADGASPGHRTGEGAAAESPENRAHPSEPGRPREGLQEAVARRVSELEALDDPTVFESEELNLLRGGDKATQAQILGRQHGEGAPGTRGVAEPGQEAAPDEATGTDKAVTDRLAQRLDSDHEGAVAEYQQLSDSDGGRVLNTDLARELSPDYRADRTKSADVHEPASAFIKKLYAEKLARPTPKGEDPVVLFTAGGTGSGKTSGLKVLGKAIGNPEIVYDTNMNSFESSLGKIRAALKAGRKVEILWTYREPVDAFHGAMGRATRMAEKSGTGRTVPIQSHVDTHVGVADVMKRLRQKFRNNPNVDFKAVDNSFGKGNAVRADFDGVLEKAENALDGFAAETTNDRPGAGVRGARPGAAEEAGAAGGRGWPDPLAQYGQESPLHRQPSAGLRDGEALSGLGREGARGRLARRLHQVLDEEHAAGRIPESIYRGFAGRNPAMAREIPRGQSEVPASEPAPAEAGGGGSSREPPAAPPSESAVSGDRPGGRGDGTAPAEAHQGEAPAFGRAAEYWRAKVGGPAFHAITRATKKLIANDFLKRHGLNLAEDMPPEAKKAWRQYRQDLGKVQKTVAGISKEAATLTPDERVLVSDFIEREMKAGVTPPAKVERTAAVMTSILRKQSAELVDLGMLSEESRNRWDGRYLPRFYARHLLSAPFSRELRKMYVHGMRGGHLRGRGLFEQVAVQDVPEFEQMGWELRGKDGKPVNLEDKAPSDTVQMWRDFTPAEREKMGEVRDAMFRFARGYTETQADIAKGRLFATIADDLARDDNPGGGWAQVPDTSVPGTGLKRFGKLAGKWVPGDVLSELSAKAGPNSELTRAYLKGLSFWKEGKTSLNPVTHVNNVVSNLVMADLAGINLLDPRSHALYAKAFADYRKKGPVFQEAQLAGLFGGEWYGNEVGQYMPTPAVTKTAKSSEALAARFANKIISGAQKGRHWMGKMYQAEDQLFKLLLYKQARDRGLSPENAVTWAERWVFDYSTLAPGARKIKNTAIPFFSYTSKAVPALTYAATHFPWRVAKWIALLAGFNTFSFMSLYGKDSDQMQDSEGKLLPEYLRGRSSFFGVPKAIRLPWNDPSTGEAYYVDISRFVPLGDLFDTENQMGGTPLPAPVMPNNPLLTIALGMLGNKDSFTGKDIVRESDTGSEAAGKRLWWLYRQMAPNSPLIPGTYNFNRLANAAAAATGSEIGPYTGLDYNGATISPGRAFAQTFGVKLRTVDLDREKAWQVKHLEWELRDLTAQANQLRRNQSISDSTREKELRAIEEKQQRLRDRMAEIASLPVP